MISVFIFNLAKHPWRKGQWFDAIVCDPPYGVRAGAKKISHSTDYKSEYKSNGERRYPAMVAYEMSELVTDLIKFASAYLMVKGRLVFWLPTLNEEYIPEDIPSCRNMRLISNSEQNFGKWSRRLITMEKTDEVENIGEELVKVSISKPGHSHFRKKYFNESYPSSE